MNSFNEQEAKGYVEEFLGETIEPSLAIEDAWYDSDEQDFSLYEGEAYLIYLLKAHTQSRDNTLLAVRFLKQLGLEPKSLLDCGTGLGLFAAMLAQSFPPCQVVATNLDSFQLEFNAWLFNKLDLSNLRLAETSKAEGEFEIIFALEYFEHFRQPAVELQRLVEMHRPKMIVESSSFSHKGLGHFREYEIDGETFAGPIEQKGAGPAYRRFSKFIKALGFRRIPLVTKSFSHGRPRLWQR